ncbi:MAG: methyltransferase domain-containing protein [Gammaproteobacteria bacterium]
MGLRTPSAPGEVVASDALVRWYRREPGAFVAATESHLLGNVLPDLFGFHIVQLGCHHVDDLLRSSRISHKVRVELGGHPDEPVQLRCAEDALPLAASTVDVLVLPHVLEFADDPRRVLREAQRVLIGEGHLVVLGFSPWSWYGFSSLFLRWHGHAPWNGHFISTTRLKDWLQLLGFDIVALEHAGFRPPLRNGRLNRTTAFLERVGARLWPALGNFYVLVGKKRVEGVTPLRVSWKQRRRLLAGGVVEPSTRGMRCQRGDDDAGAAGRRCA